MQGNVSVTHLDLRGNKFELVKASEDRPLFQNLNEMMNAGHILRSLNLSSCTLGDNALKSMFLNIRQIFSLRELILDDNSITDTGFAYLLESIKSELIHPRKLAMNTNSLTDVSMESLCMYLKENPI